MTKQNKSPPWVRQQIAAAERISADSDRIQRESFRFGGITLALTLAATAIVSPYVDGSRKLAKQQPRTAVVQRADNDVFSHSSPTRPAEKKECVVFHAPKCSR
jgi:hypothetical protein